MSSLGYVQKEDYSVVHSLHIVFTLSMRVWSALTSQRQGGEEVTSMLYKETLLRIVTPPQRMILRQSTGFRAHAQVGGVQSVEA